MLALVNAAKRTALESENCHRKNVRFRWAARSEGPKIGRDKRGYLPAVAAVAAITAIAATPATATTTAITTTAAATTATIPAAATAATGAFRLRAGFVDNKVPTTEVLTVEAVDRAIRVFIAGDFDEGESTRLPREAVTNETDCRRTDTSLSKPFLELFFRCAERKITDVKLLHLRTPSVRNLKRELRSALKIPCPPRGQPERRAALVGGGSLVVP